MKFAKTLCGASFIETDALFDGSKTIVITAVKVGRKWQAQAMARCHYRFIPHEKLEAFRATCPTRAEATEMVLAGLTIMAGMSPPFVAWAVELEETMDKANRRR